MRITTLDATGILMHRTAGRNDRSAGEFGRMLRNADDDVCPAGGGESASAGGEIVNDATTRFR